jgi:hypothetical protein
VETVPPNMLLKKQMRNNARLYLYKPTDFTEGISIAGFIAVI